MRMIVPLFGLALAAGAVPAGAQVSYVNQARRVEAIPDNNPPPTQTTGTTSQQAGDFGPFSGATHALFYWGQPGYDYGGIARVTQNSTLLPTGVSASGSLDVDSDTVYASGRSTLDTTFDVATASPYRLSIAYGYFLNEDADSTGTDGVVELRRVASGGDVTLVRREADFFLDPSSDLSDTTDVGTLTPGRYRLTMDFQASSNEFEKNWTYDVQLAVPEPSALGALTLAGAPLLLRRRRGK